MLAELPPLPPASRISSILAPVAISIAAIRDAADRAAPRTFAGKADNPASQILQNADIGWTASRGPIAATGAQDVLSLATPLTGTLNVTGSLSSKATGAVGNALGSLLGGNAAKQIGSVNIKKLNANAEIKGNITITSRPKLAAAWHLEPNLAGQVTLGDTNLSVAGARVNVPAQVKPLIDKTVADQLDAVDARIRNDPAFEQNAQDTMGQGLPLDSAAGHRRRLDAAAAVAGAAADPRHRGAAACRRLGGHADRSASRPRPASPQRRPSPTARFRKRSRSSRRLPAASASACRSTCPSPTSTRSWRRNSPAGPFPRTARARSTVTVKHATVAASGDRLLISLLVHAKEKKSFFGFGGEATVHIWGRPVLDQAQQTLRLTDIQLAVESEAAFGLLGAAAREAMPHLQRALAEKAIVDLKPFVVECAEKDRGRDSGFPEERRRRAGGGRNHQPAASPTSPSIPRRCA